MLATRRDLELYLKKKWLGRLTMPYNALASRASQQCKRDLQRMACRSAGTIWSMFRW
jgi:hypothetical protein